MTLHRDFGGQDGARPDPSTRLSGLREERRAVRTGVLATGTLACPDCDAPVSPGPAALGPADPLGCPWCGHGGPVREFLSLTPPSRPARVQVRVVDRPR